MEESELKEVIKALDGKRAVGIRKIDNTAIEILFENDRILTIEEQFTADNELFINLEVKFINKNWIWRSISILGIIMATRI